MNEARRPRSPDVLPDTTDVLLPREWPEQVLCGVHFTASAPWNNEAMSAHLGVDGQPGSADSILPARLDGKGRVVPITDNQRADGVVIRKRQHDRIRNRSYVSQVFVPWANVKGLQYREE